MMSETRIKALEKRVDKLEKMVDKIEKTLKEAVITPPANIVYREDDYVIVKSTDLFGGYIVVTPEGKQYPYADLKRAMQVLKMLKSK